MKASLHRKAYTTIAGVAHPPGQRRVPPRKGSSAPRLERGCRDEPELLEQSPHHQLAQGYSEEEFAQVKSRVERGLLEAAQRRRCRGTAYAALSLWHKASSPSGQQACYLLTADTIEGYFRVRNLCADKFFCLRAVYCNPET